MEVLGAVVVTGGHGSTRRRLRLCAHCAYVPNTLDHRGRRYRHIPPAPLSPTRYRADTLEDFIMGKEISTPDKRGCFLHLTRIPDGLHIMDFLLRQSCPAPLQDRIHRGLYL